MGTQILVIFVIRTWARAWTSRADVVLVLTSFGALVVACAIALTPIGHAFSFVPVPMPLLLTVASIVIVYLGAAEAIKNAARRRLR
jgi:P-type Mg2+ transporter